MENALCSDGIPYGGDGGGDTDGTSGSNGGTVSREAKGTENGYLRASVLRRGTFGAKVPKNLETFSPVRCGLGESKRQYGGFCLEKE